MNEKQRAFVIDTRDNVATALTPIVPGTITLLGESPLHSVPAVTEVPKGHKIALRDIQKDELITKYGVTIGRSIADIPAGSWVHLHNICSIYDERSSHLDINTGAPKDTIYE